jgi:hypothetical protein
VAVKNQQKVVFKTITFDKIKNSRYQQHVRKRNISVSALAMRSTLKTWF